MSPLWSVLIPSTRAAGLTCLMDILGPQLAPYGGQVTVLALWNHGQHSVGWYRQQMVETASAEYVCFVDDDDRVPENYCDRIMKALADRPDYVGFTVRLVDEHWRGASKPAIHSIKYDCWSEDPGGWYRHVSHLNPIRRDLALEGSLDGPAGEDQRWANEVHPFLRSEVFIDQDMYYYQFNPADSTLRGTNRQPVTQRPALDWPHFYWHPEST